MALRLLCALAACVALAPEAVAGENAGVVRRTPCSVVRYCVARYGESAAEAWARSKGANEVEIESARRCLSTPVRTVRN
jgi:hypothetical protein